MGVVQSLEGRRKGKQSRIIKKTVIRTNNSYFL